MKKDIAIILGTRPEIIKLSPIIHQCKSRDIDFTVLHTGQHYSNKLDAVFFDQLEIPTPNYNLDVGSGSHGEQTGTMLIELERLLQRDHPDRVLVQGDTNSVLAGAIVASKLNTDLGHVEAGLRSFDRDMPEEINRIITDHVADYLFPPTKDSKENLIAEGISPERITVTGNTIVDALFRNRELACQKSTVLKDLNLRDTEYFLMTAHREENVDYEHRFRDLLNGVGGAAEEHGVDVIYPIHPRAKDRLEEWEKPVPPAIRLIEPLDYLDFLRLEMNAKLILTDSGGVQEEACILGIPCVTLRENTERPETVAVGANLLSGVDPGRIKEQVRAMTTTETSWSNPYGDGTAAVKILNKILPDTKRIRQ